MGVTLAGFVLLRGVALLLMAITRRLPRSRHVVLQLAIANIHRPGALTPSIVLSLGLGLALLVDFDFDRRQYPRSAAYGEAGRDAELLLPRYSKPEAEGFEAFLKDHAPEAKTTFVPMMRGRIVKLKDMPAEQIKAKESAAWALQGDRGITYADSPGRIGADRRRLVAS